MYQGEPLTIDLPHLTIAAKQWGNPKGLPILALHGWLDNAASFDRLAPLLTDYYWVTVDLPGHGLSEHKPIGDGYHFGNYATDVLLTADALNWQQFALVGHSMGAGIATLVAGTWPNRVSHLVLIDTIGPLADQAENTPNRLKEYHASLTKIIHKPAKTYASLAKACLARKKFGVSQMDDGSIETIVARGTKQTPKGIAWRHDPQLLVPSPIRLTETQVAAFLAQITAPTCFIQAEQGYPFPEQIVKARCQQIKHLQAEVLPGGHHLHLDNPQIVANVLKLFF